MPATAGRVRMPANNRVHSSAALQTHGIWQSAIGYDPYAPNKDDAKNSGQQKSAAAEPEAENTYASFQGLLALARITGTNADEARGACKKCGRVGHLTYQCRNFLSVKDDVKEKDPEAVNAAALPLLDKLKGVAANKLSGKNAVLSDDESEEEEESDVSDSDVDSEMERIIAERYDKKLTTTGNKLKSSKKKKDDSDDNDSASDSDAGERRKKKKKRGRSRHRRSGKKRSSYSSDEESDRRRKRRKEKRRRKSESSDDDEEGQRRQHRKARREKRRRRSHYSDESDSDVSDDSRRRQKRRSRKAATPSDSEVGSSDDYCAGKRARKLKRSSRKHRDRNPDESS